METMNDTIYPGQEFFRIIHEGERAGLYRVEVLPTGKEEVTLLGAPLMVEVVDDAAGDGRALAMEWLDPNGTRHTLTDQAHRQADGSRRVAVLPAGERIHIDVLPLPGGGMEHGTGGRAAMSEGLFDAVLASLHDRGWDLQKTSCTRQGEQQPQGHPWPVLHELNETYKVGALPADDGSGLVLHPAAGLLRSEKLAALRYARNNIEALLHDLALEHLPRQVWLAVPDTSKGGRRCA